VSAGTVLIDTFCAYAFNISQGRFRSQRLATFFLSDEKEGKESPGNLPNGFPDLPYGQGKPWVSLWNLFRCMPALSASSPMQLFT